MKLAAAILIIAASVFAGRCFINKLILREKRIKQLIYLTDELISAVNFSKKPLAELLSDLSESCEFAKDCCAEMSSGLDIHSAWNNAAGGNFGDSPPEETALLIDLGSRLGRSDCEHELALLREYRERFLRISFELNKENSEKKRICTAASWLLGAFLAVLVI